MRKLRKAEKKLIREFPKDIMEKDDTRMISAVGRINPNEYPKGTNERTILNLFNLKVIKVISLMGSPSDSQNSSLQITCYPMVLTNKGRYLRKKLNEED